MAAAAPSPSHQSQTEQCRLVALRIERFKSFRETVEIDLSGSTFTAIVGPNGAGKSSVVDAVWFVFGAAAASRGGVAKLVNESELCDAAQSQRGVTSTVAIRMETSSGVVYTVLRRIVIPPPSSRGGARSEYEVNGMKHSQGQVQTFLHDSFGIDIKNPTRFILMQSTCLSIVRQG